MSRKWRWAVLGLAVIAITAVYGPKLFPQRAISTVSFTMVVAERAKAANETSVREIGTKLVARRSDGSRLDGRWAERRPGDRVFIRSVSFPADARRVLVHDYVNAVSSLKLGQTEADRLLYTADDPSCADVPSGSTIRFIGRGTHLGYEVAKKEARSQNARWEIWEAPALNCERLLVRLEKYDARGAVVQFGEQMAMSVELGEPASELFGIPAGSDLPPSELFGRIEGGARSLHPPEEQKLREVHDKGHQSPSAK